LPKRGKRIQSLSSSDSGSEAEGEFGAPQALLNSTLRNPEKQITEWFKHVRMVSGGTRIGHRWNHTLYSESLRKSFGQNTSLFRAHHMLSQALDVAVLEKSPVRAVCMFVQLGQAIHQAAMDGAGGGWPSRWS